MKKSTEHKLDSQNIFAKTNLTGYNNTAEQSKKQSTKKTRVFYKDGTTVIYFNIAGLLGTSQVFRDVKRWEYI
jgi:hypothetical protein